MTGFTHSRSTGRTGHRQYRPPHRVHPQGSTIIIIINFIITYTTTITISKASIFISLRLPAPDNT
jgi:hypothetical protein